MSARCYTLREVRDKLKLPKTTFYTLWHQGRLPFLEELHPRLGRQARFRADLIDRWLENKTIDFAARKRA